MRRFAIAAFVLAASLARAEYADILHIAGAGGQPKEYSGEVQVLTNKEIKVLTGGAVISFGREQVVGDVAWDDESVPSAMNNARAQFASSDYKSAAANYLKAYNSAGTRQVLKQECAFKMAEAYRLATDFANAATSYQKLLKDFPESFYIREAYASIVDCFMFGQPPSYPEARKWIADISGKAKDLGLSDDFVGELKLKDARMYEQEKNFPSAQGVYSGLTNSKTPRIQWSATAGLGICQMAAKELDKAKVTFQKVIDGADKSLSSSLGRAYLGMGKCLLSGDIENAANVKEALLCFLRVYTLYPPGQNEMDTENAEAMMNAGKCFFQLAKLEPAGEQKDKYGQEGQKLAARFIDQYGGEYPAWAKAVRDPFTK